MWKTVKLGDVLGLQNGYAFKSKEYSQAGHFLIRITNVQQGYLSLHNPKYVAVDKQSGLEKFALKERDIVISLTGDVGRVAVVMPEHLPAALNQRVAKVIHIDNEKLDNSYLFYFLNSKLFRDRAESFARGAAQLNISTKDILTTSIPLPPLAEQKRIVERLDKAFAEIDKGISITQSQITYAENLSENVIAKQFSYKDGYSRKTLQDICEKITDGTHQTPKYYDEGYIFVSSKNVTSRKIDWKNVKYVDESQHTEMQKRLSPKVGDVLLAKNGTTGVAAIVDKDVTFNIYVSLCLLRSKGDVMPEYLLNFVNSKVARQQFSKRTKGIGVPNLHLREIREVEISFPNELSQQQRIVSKVSGIDEAHLKYCDCLTDKLENLKILKSAILKKELTPSEAA